MYVTGPARCFAPLSWGSSKTKVQKRPRLPNTGHFPRYNRQLRPAAAARAAAARSPHAPPPQGGAALGRARSSQKVTSTWRQRTPGSTRGDGPKCWILLVARAGKPTCRRATFRRTSSAGSHLKLRSTCDLLERCESQARIYKAIDRLGPAPRRAAVLPLGGASHAEAVASLDISPETVSSHRESARGVLAKALGLPRANPRRDTARLVRVGARV